MFIEPSYWFRSVDRIATKQFKLPMGFYRIYFISCYKPQISPSQGSTFHVKANICRMYFCSVVGVFLPNGGQILRSVMQSLRKQIVLVIVMYHLSLH